MITEGFEADNKQTQEKMTNLRNYFAAELRKIEASKKSGAGISSVYKSPWKFFNHLNFLQDTFTPRQTGSDVPKPLDNGMADTPHSISNAPSTKYARESKDAQHCTAEKVMETAVKALEKINERREKM